MKTKQFPHVFTLRPGNIRFKAQPKDGNFSNKYLKGCNDYTDSTKNLQKITQVNINHSISFNKTKNKNPIPEVKNNYMGNPFGCTYFGQGFFRGRQTDERSSVSPYAQKVNQKAWVSSMHKTANCWNFCAGNKKEKINNQQDLGSQRQKKRAQYLPNVEQKSVYFNGDVHPGIKDNYIEYVLQNKRNKDLSYYNVNTMKHTHSLDKKPGVDAKLSIRAFNWEGIHFEVSPKQDLSLDSGKNMKEDYINDMNLMEYNFNNKKLSDSVSPKPEIQKQSLSIYNKTMKNFNISNKRGSNHKMKNSNNKEESQQNISFICPKIRLENERKKYIDRPEAQNSRRRSPQQTSVTTNSIYFPN